MLGLCMLLCGVGAADADDYAFACVSLRGRVQVMLMLPSLVGLLYKAIAADVDDARVGRASL